MLIRVFDRPIKNITATIKNFNQSKVRLGVWHDDDMNYKPITKVFLPMSVSNLQCAARDKDTLNF